MPLAAALGFVLVLQASLVVLRGVHWDEFYFYGQVLDFLQGQPLQPLQTLHVRLFAWLDALPGDSIDHIRAARAAMFACELVTIAAVAGLTRHFADWRTGLFAALLYLGAGYVFQHGFAFRTDPLATAALMAALWLLAARPLNAAVLLGAGTLGGLAAMVTIKAVLLAPAFAAIAWYRIASSSEPRWRTAARFTVAGAFAVAAFAALYAWHASNLVLDTARSTGEYAGGAASRMFARGLLPQWPYLLQCAMLAPVLFAAIAFVPVSLRREGWTKPRTIALAGLWLPVLVPVLYQNSFPYFYALTLPPVAVAAAVAGLGPIRGRFSDGLIAGLLALLAFGYWATEPRDVAANQRAVIGAAHAVFPEGTHYFDYSDMLAPMHKANFFMTIWGYQAYLESARRDLVGEMERVAVPLVLSNHALLANAFDPPAEPGPALKPADVEALRNNYVHHWGPLWVAGYTIAAGETQMPLRVRVPGIYTVEGVGVTIDGTYYRPGMTMTLSRGEHLVDNAAASAAILRWGDHLAVPAGAAPSGAIFRGF